MHVCRHTTLGELHVYTGLVSKTTSLRINMSCVSCSLQASPHKYDVTTLPIDTVFCHGYKSHSRLCVTWLLSTEDFIKETHAVESG